MMSLCLKKKVLWSAAKSLHNASKYGSTWTSFYGCHTFSGNRLKDFSASCLPIPSLSLANRNLRGEPLVLKRYKSLSAHIDISSIINNYNVPSINSWCSFGDFSRRYLQTVDESTSDLKRFLSEVGTDPREARFWLKHFRNVEQKKPFAILQIDPELFNNPEKLESLTSSLSFLHRNNMKPVIVCGSYLPSNKSLSQQEFQKLKSKTTLDMAVFTSLLEAQGVKARPLFVGCGLVQCEDNHSNHHTSNISSINIDLIQWCLHTKHIPVVSALGETPSGQVVPIDLWSLTGELSKLLEPLKVMKINLTGGLTNENHQVIPNVNLPIDLNTFEQKPWFSPEMKTKAHNIYNLLQCMPCESSVVITSVESILQELFTHKGSGTFFKITEPINTYTSYGDIDIERLKELFNKSFQKELKDDYLDEIKSRIDKIYLSQKYNAAAIILRDETNIPYLCKIGVSAKAQGEGTGEMLWDSVRSDYKQLYWRSRIDNVINSWYFKKSEGSWSNGNWTVFWYGVSDPSLSTKLINLALQKEESFIMPSKKVSSS